MGVTIHYRGTLADLGRVEDFEDRVLDLVLELGGHARIWRSSDPAHPGRMVRGILVDLYPGQETTSLLVSPKGWLIGLMEIKAAEKGKLNEPPWCFVKTQFGRVEGHVALVEMLAALKREFLPNLEVLDEGEYWETRNLAALAQKMAFVQTAIDAMAEGLERHGLSPEAAEDPVIVATRIERIAELVHRTLSRPAEHPPVHWEDDDPSPGDEDNDGSEALWDASFKENRRRQERMSRAMEERLARGEDAEEAFDGAMHEETALGLPEDPEEETPWEARGEMESLDGWDEACGEDEPWKESLSEDVDDEDQWDDDDEDFTLPPRHPLQRRVMDLMLRLDKLFENESESQSSHASILLGGAGEMLGGLAQALSMPREEELECISGLAVVQLKRALRGAAFALGALVPLRENGALDQQTFDKLRATIKGLQDDVFAELSQVRERPEGRSG